MPINLKSQMEKQQEPLGIALHDLDHTNAPIAVVEFQTKLSRL